MMDGNGCGVISDGVWCDGLMLGKGVEEHPNDQRIPDHVFEMDWGIHALAERVAVDHRVGVSVWVMVTW